MSRLDELIVKLCPEGVEYRALGKCVQKIDKVKWNENTDVEFQYIDLTSVDRDTHTITETTTISYENAPSRAQQIVQLNDILLGATRPMLKRYCMIPLRYSGEICSTGFCVLRAKEEVLLPGYLYHAISTTSFFDHVEKFQKGASYPAISDADVKKYKLPVPPIEVQGVIVRILDNFTELTTELTAELTARKTQYEYYRDKMLTFDNDMKKMPLSDVADVFRGEYITKKDSKPGDIPVILGGQEPAYYIDRPNHEGEIVVIARSGISAGFVSYWNQPIYVTDGFGYEAKEGVATPKYLYYVLKRKESELNAMKRGAGVPHVSGEMLGKVELPIPPIDVQRRLVNVLDNFNAICSDLNIGLPAEIEARQKQYEYYRDLLLTFAETGSTLVTDRQTDRQTG